MVARNTVYGIYLAARIAILVLALGTSNLNGQSLAAPSEIMTDSIDLLNGKLIVAFKNISLGAAKPNQFRPLFSKSIDTVKVWYVNGFRISENATLEFYQTSIDKPVTDDGGIFVWNSIALFTDQIVQSRWLESGWKAVGGDNLYFVKIISDQKTQRYFELAFFYIDNKLSFSALQCPLQFSQKYKHLAEENYLSLVSN